MINANSINVFIVGGRTMKEKVERLLRLLKEEQVIEKIKNAKDPVEVYKKYEEHFSIEILEVQVKLENNNECSHEVTSENAI